MAAMALFIIFWAACLALVTSGALPVEQLVSRWERAPRQVPSTTVPDGPLLGRLRDNLWKSFAAKSKKSESG